MDEQWDAINLLQSLIPDDSIKKNIKNSAFEVFFFSGTIYSKVKVSPLQAMKAHEGCECKGPHIHSHGSKKR